ncbi:alpha-crystallin A chain-like [Saccostrea echinata]|uniref:alpha-crystallin A chain-like n=1 Tax=Saccostrea echinata TaxID=191078 RepID=UPI002A8287DA|nr:alpha-crystallin A chain-like [Saccostrea echinata]
MSRLVPVDYFDWGFFDRQKSLFPKFKGIFNESFEDFDKELEQIRKEMFQLTPLDFGAGFDKDPFGKDFFGKDPFAGFGSSMLKVEKPFIEDISGNKKLNLKFDCSQFKPEEITVKTVDRNLTVQAKHVEESPGKKIHREFTKSYTLPENIDPMKVTSTLSGDGVLCIEAPAPKSVEVRNERIIPIEKLAIK